MFFQNYQKKINDLKTYRRLYVEYYKHYTSEKNKNNERISLLRKMINEKTYNVINLIKKAGIKTTTIDSDNGKEVDIFINIFSETIPGVSAQSRLTILDYTIGAYKTAKEHHDRNIFNPIYIVSEVIRIPYYIMWSLDINYKKIESSFLGKLYKSIASIIFIIVALLKGANLLGVDTHILHNNNKDTQSIEMRLNNEKQNHVQK